MGQSEKKVFFRAYIIKLLIVILSPKHKSNAESKISSLGGKP